MPEGAGPTKYTIKLGKPKEGACPLNRTGTQSARKKQFDQWLNSGMQFFTARPHLMFPLFLLLAKTFQGHGDILVVTKEHSVLK